MHLTKVCAYKRVIYSTAHWYRHLTWSCMDMIVGHGLGESSLLMARLGVSSSSDCKIVC